ncbi:hypothetical protein V502_08274 [Pseudogymnoascus sp. VKM F-4520 (FW-2644)]|nr:hypothetical protein V502_08274 [Pseudogymnoascus sp. VKM F-4520 (FW-2644)]
MRHVSQQASPRTPWTAELKHRRLKPRRFEHTDTDRRVEMEPHGSGTSRLKGHPSQASAKSRRLAQKGPDQKIDPAPPCIWYGALHARAPAWETYLTLAALGFLALSRTKIAGIRWCVRSDVPMRLFKQIETDDSVPKAALSPSKRELGITVEG